MGIAAEDKLAVYNGALNRLGSRPLASLTENRHARRVLDSIWGPADSLLREALGRADWNFAIRSVEASYDTGIVPQFGWARAFQKPDDIVRLVAISADERFGVAMNARDYADESGLWLCGTDVLFVRYVSDGDIYGRNSAAWTEGFSTYLECALAWEACETLTNAIAKRDRIERDRDRALAAAQSRDAMDDGAKMLPRGSWSSSRGKVGRRA